LNLLPQEARALHLEVILQAQVQVVVVALEVVDQAVLVVEEDNI
jgi:hypothetical protein